MNTFMLYCETLMKTDETSAFTVFFG